MGQAQDVGITGGVNVSFAIAMTMGAFFTISLYNVIELNFIIFTTFKQRSGLYFWSFVVGTWGIAPHSIGFLLKFFNLTSIWPLPVALVAVGFVAMVTGQSLVLYSRLHLVVQDVMRIRWILYMIIIDAIVINVPLIILAFGVNSLNPNRFIRAFTIFDKIQIAIFFVQEALISIVYIYETVRLLGSGNDGNQRPLRRLLAHLLFVNLMVLIIDITLLGIQYAGHYEIQVTYKAAVYSVKLKIEFSVLNHLINVVKNKGLVFGSRSGNSFSLGTLTGSKATQFDMMNSASHGADTKVGGVRVEPDDNLRRKVSATESAIENGLCNSSERHLIGAELV